MFDFPMNPYLIAYLVLIALLSITYYPYRFIKITNKKIKPNAFDYLICIVGLPYTLYILVFIPVLAEVVIRIVKFVIYIVRVIGKKIKVVKDKY